MKQNSDLQGNPTAKFSPMRPPPQNPHYFVLREGSGNMNGRSLKREPWRIISVENNLSMLWAVADFLELFQGLLTPLSLKYSSQSGHHLQKSLKPPLAFLSLCLVLVALKSIGILYLLIYCLSPFLRIQASWQYRGSLWNPILLSMEYFLSRYISMNAMDRKKKKTVVSDMNFTFKVTCSRAGEIAQCV